MLFLYFSIIYWLIIIISLLRPKVFLEEKKEL